MPKKLNLLLIRLSSIGDLCLTFDFVNSFSHQYNITFVTYKKFQDVLKPIESLIIEKVLLQKETFKDDVWALKNGNTKYDLILDLQGSLRSFYLRLQLHNIPSLSFDKRRFERMVHLHFKKDIYFNHKNISTRYINETEKFLGQKSSNTPSYKFSKKAKKILIAAGASFVPKRWPLDNFLAVCSSVLEDPELNEYEIIFIGQNDDQTDRINEYAKKSNRIQSKINQTNISELFEVMSQSNFLLSNDSGPMHMGQSLGLPTIGIFGPTHPYFGFVPLNMNFFMFEQNIHCRPCSLIGNKPCHQPENICFTKTTPDHVFSKLKEMVLE
ncbi:glycosyltransferase family 9 protein [Bacteriovoracaceae bacterium]|nr:glycosyltransferase family 9 protein [Bacteriovoracaceae bacterium]